MRLRPAALALALILGLAAPAAATADSAARFHATVDGILAQPYQPDYVPTGTDSAFGAARLRSPISASFRASWAPRQKWMPPKNDSGRMFRRVMSRRSGSG